MIRLLNNYTPNMCLNTSGKFTHTTAANIVNAKNEMMGNKIINKILKEALVFNCHRITSNSLN
jgi:hypothetical protein